MKIRSNTSEENIAILVACGDSKSLEILSRKWWKKLEPIFRIHAQVSGEYTEGEDLYEQFKVAVWIACKNWQQNQITANGQTAEQVIFYSLQDPWSKEYQKHNAGIPRSAKELRRSVLNDGNVLTLAAASSIGVSSQTLRNWIHSGKIQARKEKYFSSTRRCYIPVWKIPYTPSLHAYLVNLKKEMLERKRHHVS